jgi:ATP-dependent protease Clp ATPase subunit
VGAPAENSTHVYFKDMIMAASDDSEDESEPSDRGAGNSSTNDFNSRPSRRIKTRSRVDRQKLIIILVGLPGRGKTFLCNKLMCYLNWWVLLQIGAIPADQIDRSKS